MGHLDHEPAAIPHVRYERSRTGIVLCLVVGGTAGTAWTHCACVRARCQAAVDPFSRSRACCADLLGVARHRWRAERGQHGRDENECHPRPGGSGTTGGAGSEFSPHRHLPPRFMIFFDRCFGYSRYIIGMRVHALHTALLGGACCGRKPPGRLPHCSA